MVLTVLSRLDYLSLAGLSVVISHSMEPSIRRFDMVVYANANYTIGDVAVYCPTPSHCYVHRVVGFVTLDTVNGNVTRVITKGDNADEADSPVNPAWVRGKVVAVVPRELWVPLALAIVAYSLYGLVKLPVIGLSYLFVFMVGFVSVVVVFALVPQPIGVTGVDVHSVHLTGVYLDPLACTVTVRYTGDLALTGVQVKANSMPVEVVSLTSVEVVFKPNPATLMESFERGEPLRIEVYALLNHVGRLRGEYHLPVGGPGPELTPFNGALLIRNPNCFPVRVNVSLRYYDVEWRWSNATHVIDGFSYLVVEPPAGARYAYAYVEWFSQGERRWVGLPLKSW